MKTILRILAIVLVITAVAGATYAVGQSAWVTQQFGLRDGRGEGRFEHDDDADDFRPAEGAFERDERPGFAGGFERGRGEHGGGINLFAITGFVRTLLPMTLVIGVVVSLSLSAQWIRRWRKDRASDTAVSN